MRKNKKTGIIGVIITIIILVLVVVISNSNNGEASFVEKVCSAMVTPIQNGLTHIKNGISGNSGFFADIDALKDENAKLKETNSELEKQVRELEIIKAENETLKEYTSLKDKYTEFTTIPGYVINKDSSNYSKNIIINIGSDDGIEKDMPVISDKGLVGHVLSVTNNTAKVETIVDSSSTVSSMITTSKDPIVVKGSLDSNKELKATYISTDVNLVQGDSVETSGLGGIYPKGILIGTIKQVVNTKNLVDRYAVVETAVDFNKLETVLVIKQ